YIPISSIKKQNNILQSTQAYVDQLEKLNLTTPEGQIEILTHFLIRILGDLFGGQGLKNCVRTAFQREGLKDENYSGTSFYCFKENALKDFSNWLNSLKELDENKIIGIATDAYQKHINIFQELESTRTTPGIKPVLPSLAKNSNALFTCRNIVIAAGFLTVGTGIALLNSYKQPKL